MNGVANGDAVNLALQGLTVQGSNNNNDNKVVESSSDRLPRGKVSTELLFLIDSNIVMFVLNCYFFS